MEGLGYSTMEMRVRAVRAALAGTPVGQVARAQLVEAFQPVRRGKIAPQPRRQKRQEIRAAGQGFDRIKRWLAPERKRQNLTFAIATLAIIVLIMVGVYLRGPYWRIYWPGQPRPETPRLY